MKYRALVHPLLTLCLLIGSGSLAGLLPQERMVPGSTTSDGNASNSSSQAAPLTDYSWNPTVSCTAIVTSIEQVLGTQYNTTTGGALYSGGGFRPGISSKRALSPPCTAGNPANATFVEFRNVTMAGSTMTVEDCSTNYAQVNGGATYPNGQNCDLTRNLFDPVGPKISNVTCSRCMSGLFVEIDRDWNATRTAPPMIGVNGTRERIDVQGFLYWNPDELDQAWHLYSGWELHPLTAWRPSGQSVPDYYIANKRLMTVATSSVNSTTVYLGSLNGFGGNVTLTSSVSVPGPIVNLSATNIALASSGWGSYTHMLLTVSAPGASPGAYLVTLTGTSGPITHQSRITLIVTKPDFMLSSDPAFLALTAGTGANSTITVTSVDGFAGTLTLTPSTITGFSFAVYPSTTTVSEGGHSNATVSMNVASSADPGVYSVAVSVTNGILSHFVVILVQVVTPPPPQGFDMSASPGSLPLVRGQTGSANITLTSVNGFAGNVTLAANIIPVAGLSCSLSTGEVTVVSNVTAYLACRGLAGAYNVLVVGNSSSTYRNVNVAFIVTDPPSLSATPGIVVVDGETTGSSIITVGNFVTPVSLRVSWAPKAGLSCSSDTDDLTGQDDAALLSCKGSAGTYIVTVKGTSGSESFLATVTFVVEDFSLEAEPLAVTVITGTVVSANITATSLNGFNRTVTLAESVSPGTGLNCSLTSTTFVLDKSVTSHLRCNGSTGLYFVTIDSTSDSLLHTTGLTVAMSDFSLSPTGLAVTVQSGNRESATLRVIGLFGFQGQVSLSASSSRTGLDVLIPQHVTVSGTDAITVLTITAAGSVPAGNYSVVISASYGSLVHSLNVSITVGPSTSGGFPTLDFAALGASLGVLVIAAVSLWALLLKRRRRKSQPAQ